MINKDIISFKGRRLKTRAHSLPAWKKERNEQGSVGVDKEEPTAIDSRTDLFHWFLWRRRRSRFSKRKPIWMNPFNLLAPQQESSLGYRYTATSPIEASVSEEKVNGSPPSTFGRGQSFQLVFRKRKKAREDLFSWIIRIPVSASWLFWRRKRKSRAMNHPGLLRKRTKGWCPSGSLIFFLKVEVASQGVNQSLWLEFGNIVKKEAH